MTLSESERNNDKSINVRVCLGRSEPRSKIPQFRLTPSKTAFYNSLLKFTTESPKDIALSLHNDRSSDSRGVQGPAGLSREPRQTNRRRDPRFYFKVPTSNVGEKCLVLLGQRRRKNALLVSKECHQLDSNLGSNLDGTSARSSPRIAKPRLEICARRFSTRGLVEEDDGWTLQRTSCL